MTVYMIQSKMNCKGSIRLKYKGDYMSELKYRSTRGSKEMVSASKAIVQGLATDGGLFVPESIPKMTKSLESLSKMSYQDLAYEVMSLFYQDFTEEELRECINNAYDDKFDTKDIGPTVKVGEDYFLELFHGPTSAFKDMALSILPYLMKIAAKKVGIKNDIVILTATSGDTGKAALEGFANVKGTEILVFYPKDGVSPIQKQQMITQVGNNTCVIGIEGNFDDAQNGVKEIFADNELAKLLETKGYQFSSANSINIGRLIPQVVYYFYTYVSLLKQGNIQLDEKINVSVPTGNFGNILAAYYAKKMGLPINKLICASNDNKVLYEFIKTGTYNRLRPFILTMSPSMDILISSNLERLLDAINDGDTKLTLSLMESLKEDGKYTISDTMKEKLEDFYGGFAKEDTTRTFIKNMFDMNHYLMDPHTAVGYAVYDEYRKTTDDSTKTVIISTASPYKFTKSTMTALDSGYEGIGEFELVDSMHKVSDVIPPKTIQNALKDPVRHKKTGKVENMREMIKEFLFK